MPTNESGLVGAIQKAVRKHYPDAWVFKVVGNPYQEAGVPDLLVCVDGVLIGLEAKFQRPGESDEHARSRATPQQLVQIDRIRRAGGGADVVLTADEALSVIERVLKERRHAVEGRGAAPQG